MFKTLGIPIVPLVAYFSSNGLYSNNLSYLYFIKFGNCVSLVTIPAPFSQRLPETWICPLLNLLIVNLQ